MEMKRPFLSSFTPSLMSHEALEEIFVQRHPLASRLVEHIRDSALGPSKHYALLVGPRGIGKTHLVALAYHRVKAMEDLRERLLIAWMREEEWGVDSFLDLLLRIFRALESEHAGLVPSERVEALFESPATAEAEAQRLLLEAIGERTLLLLVENLDDLFAGLGDKGQKKLRAFLQENARFTILATSQGLFNGVSRQDSPFYGFFRIHHLQGLSAEDVTLLLLNIARWKGDRALAGFIESHTGRARIRAVHHLAGGNHRVYVIFSQFLDRDSLDALVPPFMSMLDELTPYYQARMAWLSGQQRKIVEFLCDRRGAAQVKEIARRGFMSQQTASNQLKKLGEMGYVVSHVVGRDSFYELREPLMRLCIEVKKNRGEPISLLVDFLRLWYLPNEMQQMLSTLRPDAEVERKYLLHALELSEREDEDLRVKACKKDYNRYTQAADFVHALEVAEELVEIRGSAGDWFKQGYCLSLLGRREEEIASFEKSIDLQPANASAWYNRGLALLGLARYPEALNSFDEALKVNDSVARYWYYRNFALGELGRWEEALESIKKAIHLDLDFKIEEAWSTQGMVLTVLKRWEEALNSFDEAIRLGDRTPETAFNRAEALLSLRRWSEGMAGLDEALGTSESTHSSAGNTMTIVEELFFNNLEDNAVWHPRVTELVDLYDRHQVLGALANGFVDSMAAVAMEDVASDLAQSWLAAWRNAAGDHAELQLPLRLLDAAVRFRETRDPRVLLELPSEERALLQELMPEETGGEKAA